MNLSGRSRAPGVRRPRHGAVAAELAILLPVLVFLCMAILDYAQLFFAYVQVTNCARGGALYAASNSVSQQMSPYYNSKLSLSTQIQNAAQNAAPNLNPAPTISVGYSTSASGPYTATSPTGNSYVQVTATWTFQPWNQNLSLGYMGVIPYQTTLTRSVCMALAPS
jgi:Flp pilus assembly protein TadG